MIHPTTLQLIATLQHNLDIGLRYGALSTGDELIGKIKDKLFTKDAETKEVDRAELRKIIPALAVKKTTIKMNPGQQARALQHGMIAHMEPDLTTYGVKVLPIIITFDCTIICPSEEVSDKTIGELFWFLNGTDTSFNVGLEIRAIDKPIEITCQIQPDSFQGTSLSDENIAYADGGVSTKVEFELEVSSYLLRRMTEEPITTINAYGKDYTQNIDFFEITEMDD